MTDHGVSRWNIISGAVWEAASGWDEHLNQQPEWSIVPSLMRTSVLQSIEGTNRTEGRGRRNLPLFLPASLLSWDSSPLLLLPTRWDWHRKFLWFSGPWAQAELHHTLSWVYSSQRANHGASQPPSPHEPMPIISVFLTIQQPNACASVTWPLFVLLHRSWNLEEAELEKWYYLDNCDFCEIRCPSPLTQEPQTRKLQQANI